jgi:hypothetical protein
MKKYLNLEFLPCQYFIYKWTKLCLFKPIPIRSETSNGKNFLGGALFFDLFYLQENGNSQKKDE